MQLLACFYLKLQNNFGQDKKEVVIMVDMWLAAKIEILFPHI